MPLLDPHADVSSRAMGHLKWGLPFRLHPYFMHASYKGCGDVSSGAMGHLKWGLPFRLHPYFMHASYKGCGESAH